MLLSVGFLVRSVETANATNLSSEKIDQSVNPTGKYMMDYVVCPAYKDVNGVGYNPLFSLMVWDTQTGKSVSYSFVDGKGWVKDDAISQLTPNPLGIK